MNLKLDFTYSLLDLPRDAVRFKADTTQTNAGGLPHIYIRFDEIDEFLERELKTHRDRQLSVHVYQSICNNTVLDVDIKHSDVTE